ncbi:MAG: RNA polymerase sigma factor [Bacillota bacterium]
MSEYYDPIVEETRALHKKFEELIEPHRPSLWRYCHYLTGPPWDGEDLFQETLLKAFATMAQIWHPLAFKSYLFRIATNTRIDVLRKKKVSLDTYSELDSNEFHEETDEAAALIESLGFQIIYGGIIRNEFVSFFNMRDDDFNVITVCQNHK